MRKGRHGECSSVVDGKSTSTTTTPTTPLNTNNKMAKLSSVSAACYPLRGEGGGQQEDNEEEEGAGGEDSSSSSSSSSSGSSSRISNSHSNVWKGVGGGGRVSSNAKGGGGGGHRRNKNSKHHHHHHKNHSLGKQRKNKPLRHASTTDTDENGSDITSSTLEREAPDGGWGWVVVGAAFFVNLIADGVTFSFGVFYSEFSDVFGESKATTAWVGSLLAAMPLLSGPIASSLTDRFGCRKVTICGGLLAALGFVLSSYATSIYMLMLTFGVITGFGLSLCYVAAVVIVAYYFERRRSLATGLSVCGGGIGTFLFAPWTEYLIREYGWRGTTLILSGAFLNLCICGALMRDLEWTKKSSKKREKILQNEHDFNTQAQQNLLLGEGAPHSLDGSASLALKNERLCNSALCIPTFVREQERQNSRRIRYFSNNYGGGGGAAEKWAKVASTNNEKAFEDDIVKLSKQCPETNEKDTTKEEIRDCSPLITDDPAMSKGSGRKLSTSALGDCTVSFPHSNNSFKTRSNNSTSNNLSGGGLYSPNGGGFVESNGHAGGVLQEPTALQKQQAMKNYVVHHTRNWSGCHRHSLTYRGAVLSLKRYRLRPASSCPDIISVATADDKSGHEWKAVLSDVYFWLKGIFAWENLTNTRFLLFIMSNFLLYMWYDIPYVFLSESVTKYGYTNQQASLLTSIFGISNVFGNVFLGYIGDKKWANSIVVYGVCISICGCVTALMPYFEAVNYFSLGTVCGLFGVMIAANYALTPVILVKVVSLERFASAYGLLLLVQGVGNLVGPPIAGCLFDWTGTWLWSFLVAGGGIFISNIFILAPIYKRSEEDEKSQSSVGRGDEC